MMSTLETIRDRIDDADRRWLEALSERFDLVDTVARHKADDETALRDPLREEAVRSRLIALARKRGLDGHFVERLLREIIEHSVRRQQEFLADLKNPKRTNGGTARVGYLGVEGSFSHEAAGRHFSARRTEVVLQEFPTLNAVAEAVESGAVDLGILPIENTTAGSINEVYDLLGSSNFSIVGEERVRVEHCLMAIEDVPLRQIHRIFSHPQALTQCSRFLTAHPDWRLESVGSTAHAARLVRDGEDLSQAAIASERAAEIYGLKILNRDLANTSENFTRFVVVATEPARYDLRVPCKTSLMFSTEHTQGALLACLGILSDRELNLTKLESRPRLGAPWEYLFYVDFEGNLADPRVDEAVEALRGRTTDLKVLGTYPAGEPLKLSKPKPSPT